MVDEDVDSLLRHVGPPLLAELGLLISDAAPIGSTGLSSWLDDNADGLGPLVCLRAPAHHPEVVGPADTAAPGPGETRAFADGHGAEGTGAQIFHPAEEPVC